MRQAVALQIMIAASVLLLTASTAHATKPFDGPEAGGATFAAGIVSSIVCWTAELAAGELEEVEERADDDFDRRGWFAGLQGVYAREDFDEGEEEESLRDANEPFQIEFSLKDRNTGGLRGKFGRRCHSRFSVEIEGEWLDDFEGRIAADGTGKVNDITFSTGVGSINVKGYLLTGRVQPFALIGVGTMGIRAESTNASGDIKSDQDTGLLIARFGGGLDYYVTRNWVLSGQADYVYSATNLKILNYISVGLGVLYRF